MKFTQDIRVLLLGVVLVTLLIVWGTPAAKAAEPECAKAGHDCVEFMQQQGPAAFCNWASAFAALGAHRREQNDPSPVKLVFSRPLTELEQSTIDYWLAWGWDSGAPAPLAHRLAYAACLKPPVKL